MIPRDEVDDDSFAELLAAADEALAAGETPQMSAATPGVRERLQGGLACMQLLRSRRGVRKKDDPASDDVARETTRIGRFQLRRELGRGGFGVVLLAYDPHLRRDVALKVPRGDVLVTPELRERFQREARAAAGLDHPNIVPVFDAGEVGPVCYIASLYCPGVTLAQWLREHKDPVSFAVAAELVAALADGVQHAHDRGVVHRDLKPANVLLSGVKNQESGVSGQESDASTVVMLTADSCPLTPKITDFGLAKLLDAAGDGPTRTGAVLGTPSYMAPEQAGGKADGAGPACDVYALGAILYECLTGRPPFVGESDLDTLQQVRASEPVPPRRLRPKTPRDLETVCLKSLEKDPAKRYASAGELAADLQRFVAGEPVRARPVGAAGRLWRRCRRRPLVAGLVTALGLALALGVAGVTWQWRRAEVRGDQARADQARAEASLREALGSMEAFFIRVSETELLDKPGLQPLRRKLLEDALQHYHRLLAAHGDDPALRVEVAKAYHRIGFICHDLGARADAVVAYTTARDRFADLAAAAPDDPDLVSALQKAWHNLGVMLSKSDRQAEARQAYEESLALAARLVERHPDQPDYRFLLAKSWQSLAVLHAYANRTAEAQAAYERALALLEPLARDHPKPVHLSALALSYRYLGALSPDQTPQQLNESLRRYRQSRAVWERLARADPASLKPQHELAQTIHAMGLLYAKGRRRSDALRAYEQALPILERLVAANPAVAGYRESLARTLDYAGSMQRDLGRPVDALPRQERACALWAEVVAADPDDMLHRSDYSGAMSNLSTTLEALKRFDEAHATILRALEQSRIAFERMPDRPTHRDFLGRQYRKLARVERALGRPAASAAAVRELQRLWPTNPNQLYGVAHDLALCVPMVGTDEQKQYADEAMDVLRRAVAAGFRDAPRMSKEAGLAPLRGRDDFAALLRDQERAALPAQRPADRTPEPTKPATPPVPGPSGEPRPPQ